MDKTEQKVHIQIDGCIDHGQRQKDEWKDRMMDEQTDGKMNGWTDYRLLQDGWMDN